MCSNSERLTKVEMISRIGEVEERIKGYQKDMYHLLKHLEPIKKQLISDVEVGRYS